MLSICFLFCLCRHNDNLSLVFYFIFKCNIWLDGCVSGELFILLIVESAKYNFRCCRLALCTSWSKWNVFLMLVESIGSNGNSNGIFRFGAPSNLLFWFAVKSKSGTVNFMKLNCYLHLLPTDCSIIFNISCNDFVFCNVVFSVICFIIIIFIIIVVQIYLC